MVEQEVILKSYVVTRLREYITSLAKKKRTAMKMLELDRPVRLGNGSFIELKHTIKPTSFTL